MSVSPARLRIAVVGGGFGGLALVRALRHAPVEVTLVDQNNHHLFTPLLYQVATALLDPSEIAKPIRAVLHGQRNATFRMARLVGVDVAAHRIETSSGSLQYDRLVLALGSVTNWYGRPGFAEHAHGLKDLGDALALRNHALSMFERAAVTADAAERARLETVTVVGAGPTGVECSGAFRELSTLVVHRDFHEGALADLDVELVEAAPNLLGTFAPSLQRAALRTLRQRQIGVRLGTGVRDIDADGVVLDEGTRLRSATVVWTAGVRASPAAELLPVQLDRSGRIPVDEQLRVRGLDDVYAIGDVAAVQRAGGPHPMLAPVAMQQGRHLAAAFSAESRAAGTAASAPFRYFDKGTMATIGRNAAIAQIRFLRLRGFVGWLAWLFVHLVQIIGFRNRVVVLINWAWNYVFWDRPVRIITEAKRTPNTRDGA